MEGEWCIVYVLELEQDKFYVGQTRNLLERVRQHMEGTYASVWTKLYRPKFSSLTKLRHVFCPCDAYDEDKYTIMMMKNYGIDNVRGGSYCKPELTDAERQVIHKQLQTASNLCFTCNQKGHYASSCPMKPFQSQATKGVVNNIIAPPLDDDDTADEDNIDTDAHMTISIADLSALSMQEKPSSPSLSLSSSSNVAKAPAKVSLFAPYKPPNQTVRDAERDKYRLKCTRCGHSNHTVESCFAKTHKDTGESLIPRETK